MADIENRINGIYQAQTATTGPQVQVPDISVSVIQSSIQQLRTELEKIKADISSDTLKPINIRMSETEAKQSGYENLAVRTQHVTETNSQLITSLAGRIDALDIEFPSIKERLSAINTHASIVDLQSVQRLLNANIDSVRDQLSNLITELGKPSDLKDDVDDLNRNLSELQRKIEAAESKLERLKIENSESIENAIKESKIALTREIGEEVQKIKIELQNSLPKPDPDQIRNGATIVFLENAEKLTEQIKSRLEADVLASVSSSREFETKVRETSTNYLKQEDVMQSLCSKITENREFKVHIDNGVSSLLGHHLIAISDRVTAVEGFIATAQSPTPNFNVFGAGGLTESAAYTAAGPR
jgi:hypothetical protein